MASRLLEAVRVIFGGVAAIFYGIAAILLMLLVELPVDFVLWLSRTLKRESEDGEGKEDRLK